jgi:hypothetical protein
MIFLVWQRRHGVTDWGIGKPVETTLLGSGVSLL